MLRESIDLMPSNPMDPQWNSGGPRDAGSGRRDRYHAGFIGSSDTIPRGIRFSMDWRSWRTRGRFVALRTGARMYLPKSQRDLRYCVAL
jgi:hypothetical protein